MMNKSINQLKTVLGVLLCVVNILAVAQDYLPGKVDGNGIYYDRTQNLMSTSVYQSVYKVLDTKKKLLYTITLTHDRVKLILYIAVKKPENTNGTGITVKYERSKSGLIFSDLNNVDTTFNITKPYSYLLSFTDTSRGYPVLHKIKTDEGKEILLDPLTKIRLKKHNELIVSMLVKDPLLLKRILPKTLDETFNEELKLTADSFYLRKSQFEGEVLRIKQNVEQDVRTLFKSKKVYADAKRYEGEKKKGEAEGKGLFMSNNSYYDGTFSNGKFVSGFVNLVNDAFSYSGNYSNDSMNGAGFQKFNNGDYFLGNFAYGSLQSGISSSSTKAGEKYFGNYVEGQRSGYGEFQDAKGALYFGEFFKGKFVKGYSKEVDAFGFFTYSKIENGIKAITDPKLAEDFFTYIESIKASNNPKLLQQ